MTVETSNAGDGAGAGGEGAAVGGAVDGAASAVGGDQTGAKAPAGAGAQAAGGTAGAAAVEPVKYTPNFKYKVTTPQGGVGTKLEKEIPEWARPFITSADVEKNVRELFEKSEGIEAVKQHRDVLTQENEQMRNEWGPLVQNAQTVVGHLQRGDLDSFFEALNIPEQAVLKYALYRLQLRDNPQQLQAHEQMRQLQNQNMQLQQQVQTFSGSYENLAVQQRSMQLDSQIGRPETLQVAQAFDTRVGKPGSFRTECIRRGQMYAAQGQDVAVEQVVSEVVQLLGWQGQNAQAQQVQNGAGAAAAEGAGGTAQAEPKPTFPSIRGKGTSPAKKAITSTAQLRELARSRA
jgi:hypothetical protein